MFARHSLPALITLKSPQILVMPFLSAKSTVLTPLCLFKLLTILLDTT